MQQKRGYRFSIDAVLLGALSALRAGERLIDLGTGCGIVVLWLACRFPDCSLTGVELQPALARLAEQNVRLNGLADRVQIVQGDMRCVPQHFPAAAFEVVVSNPPYRPLKAGRLNPDTEKAIARHELAGSLSTVAQAADYLLPHGGRLYLIYPAWRLVSLCGTLRTHGLEPKTLRFIHSRATAPASLIWLEARKHSREALQILPPLTIYNDRGQYTSETKACFDL
ncbi:MAG: tRNA1(Val) (adenine(37)-N6)-methyltransferase [Desulfobacca sp.]|nr:tRNA1(Val) (adenine(37)-N6)-methyltransferase [Desulfobacca sp.]